MRFEDLSQEFTKALEMIKIEKQRDLPVINKTKNRGDFESYFSSELEMRTRKVFGPFMKKWNYTMPNNWSNKPSLLQQSLYRLAVVGRSFYSRHVKNGVLKNASLIRGRLE